MKFICSQSDLNSNLSLVSRIVPSRPEPLVLGNVLVNADRTTQKVSLTGFDGSLAIRTSFNAEVTEEGAITLPAKLFNDIVSKLPEMEISLDVDTSTEKFDRQTNIATLSSASGKYQLSAINAVEYPELPSHDPKEDLRTVSLPATALIEGLKCCLFAASLELSKQILTGIHFKTIEYEQLSASNLSESKIDSLEFAATDSHRLAIVQTSLEKSEKLSTDDTNKVDNSSHTNASDEDNSLEDRDVADESNLSTATVPFAVTIPAKALRELERILISTSADRTIKFSFDETQVIFDLGDKNLSSLKLTGSYPAYNQLIPRNFSRQMIVDRKRLLNSLELVAVLAQKNNVVKFSLDSEQEQLFLSVDARDVGNAKEVLPAEIIGDSIDIAFNIKYLMDGLKAIPASLIKMQLNEWNQPVIFTPVGGFKMTYLVMPVQLRN